MAGRDLRSYCRRSAKGASLSLFERNTFRHVCCFPSLYVLTKMFRNDILIRPSFKGHGDEYALETFLLRWLNEVITECGGAGLMQGFLQEGASLQCKTSLWRPSPLNLVLLQEIRLFSEARESALPILPPSHRNHISMRDDGRNFCEH